MPSGEGTFELRILNQKQEQASLGEVELKGLVLGALSRLLGQSSSKILFEVIGHHRIQLLNPERDLQTVRAALTLAGDNKFACHVLCN